MYYETKTKIQLLTVAIWQSEKKSGERKEKFKNHRYIQNKRMSKSCSFSNLKFSFLIVLCRKQYSSFIYNLQNCKFYEIKDSAMEHNFNSSRKLMMAPLQL